MGAAGEVMSVLIRRLVESDQNAVLEISRYTWDGHDYLGTVFDVWVNDPKCDFVGVEVEGKVVAVGNLRLIEGGRTGWLEGLRVHPDFRQRGYANEITAYLVAEGERLRVVRLRYTTSDRNVESLKIAAKAGFSRVLELAVFWATGVKMSPPMRVHYVLEETGPNVLYDLLRNSVDMVPAGVLVYDWKALEFSLESLEEIGKDHRFYVGLKNGKIDSLSFCQLRPDRKDQSWWSFTVYAHDSEGFLGQVSHSVRIALEGGLSSAMVTLEKRFEEVVGELEFGADEQDISHLIMLERKIKT
jgi:N-acetylglutamate synthase-like GNAT family acetyltransferase